MDFCYYCHKPCGVGGFCDENCKVQYDSAMESWYAEVMDDAATAQGRGFLEFDISSDDDPVIDL
jgi:hypothetical protein